MVDVWGGWLDADRTQPWQRDSIACVFSCTKGLAAIALLLLVDRGEVDLEAPVARYWPEFADAGKDELPVRYLLTHEAGLSAIGKPMPFGSLSDWDAMVERARRAGAVVGARHRARLPRRDVRASRRRSRAPCRRPHDRRVPPRRDHRAARGRLLPRPARGGGWPYRDDGARADRGTDVLLALGRRLARAEVVRQPSRLQRPRTHELAHVPRRRDPGRERARERARAGARLRRAGRGQDPLARARSPRRDARRSKGPTS